MRYRERAGSDAGALSAGMERSRQEENFPIRGSWFMIPSMALPCPYPLASTHD